MIENSHFAQTNSAKYHFFKNLFERSTGVSKVRGYTNPTNPAGLRQDYPGLGHLSLD